MLHYKIEPRFSEADPLGHINNAVVPIWFEQARTPIFQVFNPELAIHTWNLILKKFEVEFVAQIYISRPVDIRTWIDRIGNTSFVVVQEAWQSGKLVAKGSTVLVHFDFDSEKTLVIPDSVRGQLENLLLTLET